ncbi:MAG TPA: hypothetical protein VGD05_14060 [Pyrinomonadaceae bacterium]|jgi:hypothetical protein
MVEIKWNKNIEEDSKIEIEKYLNPFLWLIPKWCQSITINVYDSDDQGAAIATLVTYEYRYITVDFFSAWFIQTPSVKQDNVIHECIHFFINEIYHKGRQIVKSTCKDNEQLKEFAFEELRIAVESSTQDLAFAIQNKFNGRT